MIVVDFQTMVRLNGWRSMGLHFDASATLGGFVLLLDDTGHYEQRLEMFWLTIEHAFSCLTHQPMTILWAVPYI
jgi:hypothetical protein